MLLWIFFCFFSVAQAAPRPETPIRGYADIHNHMFAELAFGGAWLHGTTEGSIEQALAPCESGTHATLKVPILSRWIGKTLGSPGDTGAHEGRHRGFPSFSDWPRWDSIAHQQVWRGHLESAFHRGLSLLVVSLVNFEPLCEWMPEKNRKFADCSDMHSIDLQLTAAHQFQKKNPWFVIVRTPAEARAAISSGKLAVVLSLEASHIFGDEDWRPQLEALSQRGITTLQLAHQLDNRFAGAALHNSAFRPIAWALDFSKRGRFWEIFTPWRFGFHTHIDEDGIEKNQTGLSLEGEALILEMIKRGMPIDLAHLSEKTVSRIGELSKAHGGFPLYLSHGHFRPAMDDGKFSRYEKSSAEKTIELIRQSGGVFGLRTGPEKTKEFPGTLVPNDCQGSSKSFAQTYQYGHSRGLRIAFATDLNGFIQQTRPRFGNPEETCGAEPDAEVRQRQQRSQRNPLNTRFDQSGLGDLSQLPDLIEDLKGAGLDIGPLFESAEDYVRMWEKAVKITSRPYSSL